MASNPLPLLRTATLFSSCKKEEIEEIASLSAFRNYGDGETIFDVGNPSSCLYIVHAGEVVIRKDDDEGRSVDIARFLPGDFFGELDMFLGSPRNESAQAVGRVSVLVFPAGDKSSDYLKKISAGTGAALLHSFLVQVSSRTRGVNTLVKENSPIVQELKRQVYVDKLTGLNNRTYFDEVLENKVSENDRVGLLLYKPDNFKELNDRYGHDAGDKVLRLIADRLREFLKDSDMLFRYMGNENAVILSGAAREDLARLADGMGGLLRGLDLTPALGSREISLSVSFGLALYPEHAETVRDLVDAAHTLTLEGRRRGGNMTLFPEDSEEV